MKQTLQVLIIFFGILMLSTNCGKKGNDPKPSGQNININGNGNSIQKTTTNVQQLNTITLVSLITQDVITGKIGDKEVLFYKSGNNTLTYITPADLLPGDHLISFGLNGNTYSSIITIQNAVVVADPQARIDQHNTFMEQEIVDYGNLLQELVNSNAITLEEKEASLNDMNKYLSDIFTKINSLDNDEKVQAATFLEINKVELEDPGMVSLRLAASQSSQFSSLLKFKLCVLSLGGSVWAGYICYQAKQPAQALLSLVGVYLSYKGCIHYGKQSRDDLYSPVAIIINQLAGSPRISSSSRQLTTTIEVVKNQPTQFNLSIKKRSISNADASSSNSVLKSFYSYYDDLNEHVNRINETVEWVNSKLPFLSSSQVVSNFTIPAVPLQGIKSYEEIGNLSVQVMNEPTVTASIAAVNENQVSLTYNYTGTSTEPIVVESKIIYNDGDFTYAENISVTIKSSIQIGQSLGGGIVAYILQYGETGYVEGEEHALIAAANDQSSSTWSGAMSSCSGLVLNGYSGWYLPNNSELYNLYIQRNTIGGFAGTTYWTSGEIFGSPCCAATLDFGNKTNVYTAKEETHRVRAVRIF